MNCFNVVGQNTSLFSDFSSFAIFLATASYFQRRLRDASVDIRINVLLFNRPLLEYDYLLRLTLTSLSNISRSEIDEIYS